MFYLALTFPTILNAQLLIVTLTRFNILEGLTRKWISAC